MRVIICGQAASGKDYLREKFHQKGSKIAVCYTTRPKRKEEREGIDYNFLSVEDFMLMVSRHEFVEWNSFKGWLYGTSLKDFMQSDIMIMTPKGLKQLDDEKRNNSFVIWIDTPKKIRKDRLLKRSDENDSTERRLKADQKDFKNFKDYDLRIQKFEC